ncbi:MAG: methyltransferase, partial [Sandaracinaceae bacterium]|nr:methyltransferase [Sandaracinaceae bacterium]
MWVKDVAPIDRLIAAPPSVWRDLAAALRAAEYDDRVLARAEAIAPGQVDHLRLPLARWWLERQPDGAAALALLFSYHGGLGIARARELLGARLVAALGDAGVLVESGGEVWSAMRLLPIEGIWILSDHLAQQGDPAMGPGATTLRLAHWMGEVSGERVLDVGCGAGSLALVAAKRGARATGVDISERAIALTKINACLNGLEVEARAGDLFAPVAGESFDRIVAQPPFVIRSSEVEALTFLHGGDNGDELTMRIFAELAPSLAPGGRALVLFQAPVRADHPLLERVSSITAP